jgi:hypothetical protein
MKPQEQCRETVATAVEHRQPARLPVDFGGTPVTGIHVTVVAELRAYFGLEKKPVKAIEPGQMLGEIEDDLQRAMGIDVECVYPLSAKWGIRRERWKPYNFNGLEVLVPGDFNTTTDKNGDTLMYPQGDVTARVSSRMPKGGYFFDNVIHQDPIDDDKLDPADNLEEYGPISEDGLAYLAQEAKRARATGRWVSASFGGTALGDIALVPGPQLKHPKGIRDISEWYASTRARRDYIHKVFAGQVEIALQNLARIAEHVGDNVDSVMLCGTDFGTQSSSFCSVQTFDELWMPYYRQLTGWIHRNTNWRVFKHSCGAVAKFIPSFIECGFDILNPVQCSAAGMLPEALKEKFGDRITFWGGGVDTQQTLPFGTPDGVREEVLRRCEVFSRNGGFVFNTIHNVQACTPLANVIAMIRAVAEFDGR